jgi:hypothetical protein
MTRQHGAKPGLSALAFELPWAAGREPTGGPLPIRGGAVQRTPPRRHTGRPRRVPHARRQVRALARRSAAQWAAGRRRRGRHGGRGHRQARGTSPAPQWRGRRAPYTGTQAQFRRYLYRTVASVYADTVTLRVRARSLDEPAGVHRERAVRGGARRSAGVADGRRGSRAPGRPGVGAAGARTPSPARSKLAARLSPRRQAHPGDRRRARRPLKHCRGGAQPRTRLVPPGVPRHRPRRRRRALQGPHRRGGA